ncbi:helix-turn-helix transcriptional regulator [Rhodococcus sp. SGAir0479]|uniref:helix-turn-helix transcriptional regulator n=1 Tax=Rhodococcus sp. SGAir0479 TaxID=2567884 RepID=UPI0010CD15E1|nr:helix-turn-helix transcriptional regulator [Rhodococcus sp. SGAir0479]QCQ93031.1 XRE family transcriptional regulator [Rhodococcus sp. SGAir0479]
MGFSEEGFRRRVKFERERREWTQAELADQLNARGGTFGKFYPSTIAKIENPAGDKPRAIRLDEAAALADVFGVGIDEMLGARKSFDRKAALEHLGDVAARSYSQISGATAAVMEAVAGLRLSPDDLEELAVLLENDLLRQDDPATDKKAILAQHTALLFRQESKDALRTLSGVTALARLPESEVDRYWKTHNEAVEKAYAAEQGIDVPHNEDDCLKAVSDDLDSSS